MIKVFASRAIDFPGEAIQKNNKKNVKNKIGLIASGLSLHTIKGLG